MKTSKTLFFLPLIRPPIPRNFLICQFSCFLSTMCPTWVFGKAFIPVSQLSVPPKQIYLHQRQAASYIFSLHLIFFFSSHKNSSFGNISLGAFFNLQGDEMLCTMQWGQQISIVRFNGHLQHVHRKSLFYLLWYYTSLGFFTAYGRTQKKFFATAV